jgi:hypothetical protein
LGVISCYNLFTFFCRDCGQFNNVTVGEKITSTEKEYKHEEGEIKYSKSSCVLFSEPLS